MSYLDYMSIMAQHGMIEPDDYNDPPVEIKKHKPDWYEKHLGRCARCRAWELYDTEVGPCWLARLAAWIRILRNE